MTVKWYQQAARTIQAIQNCQALDDIREPQEKIQRYHEPMIKELEAMLPHGSGIDGETGIDIDASRSDRIVVYGSYHCMSEYGYYTHWIDYTVVIKPSLMFGFDILIRGNFGRDQDIKEYLYDLYSDVLGEEVNVDRVRVVNQ